MNLPVTTWESAVWWSLTAMLVGFWWTVGCWLAGRILGRIGK